MVASLALETLNFRLNLVLGLTNYQPQTCFQYSTSSSLLLAIADKSLEKGEDSSLCTDPCIYLQPAHLHPSLLPLH